MDTLIVALGPIFAAGFAVQQLLELLDPLFKNMSPDNKKIVFSLLALCIGMILSFTTGLHTLQLLAMMSNPNASIPSVVDAFVTGLILSAGTGGINSVLKLLNYQKKSIASNIK